MRCTSRWTAALAVVVLGGCGGDDPRAPPTDPSITQASGDTGAAPCEGAPGWDEAQGYLRTWCLPCHSETVTGEDRQGAPVGVDFDTYAQVITWRAAIEQRATGPDADMPPVPGATDDATERFATWLECGAEGTDDLPDRCDPLVPVSGAPGVLSTAAEADDFCAEGNQAPGDLQADVDIDCLCAVDGDLVAGDTHLPLLASVGGDLTLSASAPNLPALLHVGGALRTGPSAGAVLLPSLETVGGDVVIDQGSAPEIDLSGLLTVGGRLEVAGLPTVDRIDLSRLRIVGEDLRLAELSALAELEGLVAVSSVGRGLSDVGVTPPGPDQGGIELTGLGLPALDVFRLLTSVGGPIRITQNPSLMRVDGFTTLPMTAHPVEVSGNPQLGALEGFDQLQVAHDIEVRSHANLPNVFAFVNLREAAVVTVEANPQLRSLLGLEAIEEVDSLRLSTLAVIDVPWFTSLHTVRDDLVLSDLPNLGRVSGLTALTSVGGDLEVIVAPQLRDLEGPGELTSVGGAVVLDDLGGLVSIPLLGGIASIGGDLRIVGTGLSQLDELGALQTVGGDLEIRHNESLPATLAEAFADVLFVDGTASVGENGP